MASDDRRNRKLRFRQRALQNASGNVSTKERLKGPPCFSYDGSIVQDHDRNVLPASDGAFDGHRGCLPSGWTGANRLDTFDDTAWRSILQQFPSIRWNGDDPWYLAEKYEKKTKSTKYEWEPVPLIRPQDLPRYKAYKDRNRKDLDKDKKYVVWPAHVERAFEIGETSLNP